MSESKPIEEVHDNEGINALNLLGRAEEEIEAILQKEISSSTDQNKEEIDIEDTSTVNTHDENAAPNLFDRAKEEIDIEDTSIVNTRDVKAPNLFDRAKEEIVAIVQTIHINKQQKNDDQLETTRSGSEADSLLHGKFEKVTNLIERGKEEIGAILRNRKEKSANQLHMSESETHGLRDDIDENTPLTEVKGPTVFERAKEELEAIVNAIHPKKESAITSTTSSSSNNIVDAGPSSSSSSSDGFWLSIGRQLEKLCCSPFNRKKD